MHDLLDAHLKAAVRRKLARDEQIIRELLGRWVSELEPCVAYDPDFEIIGLCPANAPLGSSPFILRVTK